MINDDYKKELEKKGIFIKSNGNYSKEEIKNFTNEKKRLNVEKQKAYLQMKQEIKRCDALTNILRCYSFFNDKYSVIRPIDEKSSFLNL